MNYKLTDLLEPFGIEDIPFALFYQFQHALRFELGIGSNRLSQTISAFDRSRMITKSLIFPDFRETYAVFRTTNEAGAKRQNQRFFKTLKNYMKLARTDINHCGVTPYPDDSDLCCHWYAVKLREQSDIDSLLWFPASAEMGFEPQLWANIYLLNRNKKILIHPYDDRGMDVISMDKATLLPLYHQYNEWLLDYDRARMVETFSSR